MSLFLVSNLSGILGSMVPGILPSQSLPDLAVSAVQAPLSATRGTSFTVHLTASNRGTASVPGGWTINVYLSSDAVITPADPSIGSAKFNQRLDPGGSGVLTLTVPAGAAGKYFVGVILDPANQVPESSESNNAGATTAQLGVISPLDVSVMSVSVPASVRVGEVLCTAVALQHLGGEPLPLPVYGRLYLSTDLMLSTSTDLAWSSFTLPAGLAAAATTSIKAPQVVPSTLQPLGTLYVFAVIDPDQRVPETDESNNTKGSTAAVRIDPAPQPLPTTLGFSWTEAAAGPGPTIGTSTPTLVWAHLGTSSVPVTGFRLELREYTGSTLLFQQSLSGSTHSFILPSGVIYPGRRYWVKLIADFAAGYPRETRLYFVTQADAAAC